MDEIPTVQPEAPKKRITQKIAAQYKGRIPTGLVKKIVALNKRTKAKKKAFITDKKDLVKAIATEEKIQDFLEEFLKNGGNATQAALTIYKCPSYGMAAKVGHFALKQSKDLARLYLEKKGVTYGRLLDVATEKMMESKAPDWWDRLMKLADYEDFLSKKSGGPAVVNVIQAHRDFASNYVDGEIEEIETLETK